MFTEQPLKTESLTVPRVSGCTVRNSYAVVLSALQIICLFMETINQNRHISRFHFHLISLETNIIKKFFDLFRSDFLFVPKMLPSFLMKVGFSKKFPKTFYVHPMLFRRKRVSKAENLNHIMFCCVPFNHNVLF